MESGFCKLSKIIKKSSNGYIFMLICVLVPVLLLAVRYCVDVVSDNHAKIYGGGTGFYKKCAKDAALAVAKKWNPGLTLNQQKGSLLLIADDIYNRSPCYCNTNVHSAIPGLEVRNATGESRGTYNPLKLLWGNRSEEGDTLKIPYTTVSSTVSA
ncbi:MAG: hypothetical protein LBB21_03755 [Holosporaceae bacterium]|jgi:hypothetical protein|nr:hypothetical protein [Holosporaceae bacterium]